MSKNEAELEALISGVIATIFPTHEEVQVIHQKNFSIHFGRHAVTVDQKEPSTYPTRAILDILLTVGGINMILLELKREGHELTDDNIAQGISYARLLTPMPPITVISNGSTNLFYQTYTGKELEIDSVDLDYLKEAINNSFQLSIQDMNRAIEMLLSKDQVFFSKIINSLSNQKFDRKKGSVERTDKTICEDFQIERDLVKVILGSTSEKPFTGIIGEAFSGKTNLLYQLSKSIEAAGNFVFYIDCLDHNSGIMQDLANSYTEGAKMFISVDKVRHWFINSIHSNTTFYFLIDNFNSDIPALIKNEIIELMGIFKGGRNKIVYTVDEYNFKKLAFAKDRKYKTVIGEESSLLSLKRLSDAEFAKAEELLLNNFSSQIAKGGQKASEYRIPRHLRNLATLHDGIKKPGKMSVIQSIVDYGQLRQIAMNSSYTDKVHDYYKKIAECFIAERYIRNKNSFLSTMAMSSGAILESTFEKKYPKDLKKLLRSGYVVTRFLASGEKVIYPKMPELVTYYSIDPIAQLVISHHGKHNDIVSSCKYFIDILTIIPSCDIVGSAVLLKLGTENTIDLFSGLIQELLKYPPTNVAVSDGLRMLTYVERQARHMEIGFTGDVDGFGDIISDFLPYPILSLLVGTPLMLQGEYSNPYAFHLYLLDTIGSQPQIIHRVDIGDIGDARSFSTIESDEWALVDDEEGIIEPITQSIQSCFIEIPDQIEILVDKAVSEKNVCLGWRLIHAIFPMVHSTNEKLAQSARLIHLKLLAGFLDKFPIPHFEDEKI